MEKRRKRGESRESTRKKIERKKVGKYVGGKEENKEREAARGGKAKIAYQTIKRGRVPL